ncbi:MAG TPA: DNA cytosine methyltransferase, partial [Candidatus Wirthbacteria bacterium]|nr:DNA cytosine methyltransferase [Candidatus Wirthbacteria bacterium]
DKKGLIKSSRSSYNHRLFNMVELERIHNKISNSVEDDNYQIFVDPHKTNISVIELFAGAGGTALGLDHAGLKHELLVEINNDAVATLKQNRPAWNVRQGDVREFDFKGLKADVIEGGFPCQAFSYAGKKRGFEDTRGTLFFDFARCIKQVKPKVVMGENVRGLLRHDNGKTLETIIKCLQDLGYLVAYTILRSQYLDVPQKRERLILIGVRNDLKLPILFPKEKDYTVSLRAALKDCPDSEGQRYPARKKQILAQVPPGGYWRDLPIDLQKEYMKKSYYLGGGKTGMARRLSWDEPSLTLTCAPAQKQTERCHPEETRPLNVREYARIQTFPDDWQFEGSTSSQYRQIGNAFPVNAAYHMGKCLIATLNNNPDYETMVELEPLPSI